MGEIRLDYLCRLCLKESFSLSNIFSSHSPSGDLLYRALNFVYDLKILPDDGLPPKICAPCTWKMLEFHTYKNNVHFAEAEIVKFLGETRPDSINRNDNENDDTYMESDSTQTANNGISSGQGRNIDYMKDQENRMNRSSEDGDSDNGEHVDDMLSIKDEIDIEEWEMPKELPGSGNVVGQSPGSSDLKINLSLEALEETIENSFERENSSICSNQVISVEITETDKGINENDLRDDDVPEEESLSSQMSKSMLNVRKSRQSHLIAPLPKRKSTCDICKKCFTRKQDLRNHMRVHFEERPFRCNICDKTFKWDNNRYHHELTHIRDKIQKSEKGSMNKLYYCTVCAKHFSSKKGLGVHSNLHSDKYRCKSCGKGFYDNCSLSRHLRIHTKEKPFKCDVCLKCFTTKSQLNGHLLIHSSERPFSCDICDKKFKSKEKKSRHELRHLRKK